MFVSRSRIAVVTGATSGIGRAVVTAFSAAQGTKVYPVGRSERKLAAVLHRIPRTHLAGSAIVDLSVASEVVQLAEAITSQVRRVDVLVHSGGLYGFTESGNTNDADFDKLFDTNVRGAYLLTQALVPALEKAKGQVVFINSSIVRSLGEGASLFKATQHALQGMADSMRQELNARGIRVSTLYPGQTATPRTRRIYARRGKTYRPAALLRPDDMGRLIVALANLPALMEVTDLHVRSTSRY